MLSCTARNAGADTEGGTSLPPARITNVAGTLTLVEPPEDRAALVVVALLAVAPLAGLGGVEVLADVVALDPALVAGAEAVLAEVEDVVLELVAAEWLEPPHALISRQVSASRKVCAECLTFRCRLQRVGRAGVCVF